MSDLRGDLRYGLRVLLRSRASALLTAATLSLGIGAATAMFSVIDGVLLKPLPVRDQDRLLVVWSAIPNRGFNHWPFSYREYQGIRERLRTVSGAAAHPYAGTLSAILHLDDGTAMPLERAAVTGDWFDLLGVRARAGRLLTTDDDRLGAPSVVVLSSAMAERLFGRSTDAIGRRVRIDEDTCTVVGVAPATFAFPRAAQAWVPAVRVRESPFVAWDVIVRVAPAVTLEQARADLAAALAALPPDGSSLNVDRRTQTIHAQTLAGVLAGDVRPALLTLGAGVLLVFLIAGINVANLVIARAIARRREFSIRVAIGASRAHLARQLAVEATLMTTFGGAGAVLVAFVTLRMLLRLAPPELPRVAEIAIDGRALGFAVALAALALVLFGMMPALDSARRDPAEVLRKAGLASGVSRFWMRRGLVAAQIAITVIVLSTAGLLVKSLERLQRLDVGFAAEDLMLATVAIPPSRYTEPAAVQGAMVRLAEHVAELPSVTSATAIVSAPFAGTQGVDSIVFAEGQPFEESRNPVVNYEAVDATYFRTIGLPILRGRAIDHTDRRASERVVVVNQAFARTFWPGRDPLGRRLKLGPSTSPYPWLTVVGLVADTRYRELTTLRPSIYVPYEQGIPVTPGYVAVRGASPAAVVAAVDRAVADLEPGAVVVNLEAVPRLLAAPLARPRFQVTLAAAFAAATMVLAAIGTFATFSFVVRQRRREIGIRIALGAAPSDVRCVVLRDAVGISVLGMAFGLTVALAISRIVQPLLFGTSATDPWVLATTSALVLLAVAAATVAPIRAANATDPLLVLRSE